MKIYKYAKKSSQWHIIVMVIWGGKIMDFFSLYILIFYNKQVLILS